MCNAEHASAIDKAVFPGLQGGPHNHTTAGIAVAAKEALTPEFKKYAAQVVENARVFGEELVSKGFRLVTGGTDNHLVLVDLTPKNVPGKTAAKALDRAGIVCNYNSIPFDPRKPFDPSGIRIGMSSITSRGMGVDEVKRLAQWVDQVVAAPEDDALLARVEQEVLELCSSFPAPGLPIDD
jgi:glycine hydroxymethyltransferase